MSLLVTASPNAIEAAAREMWREEVVGSPVHKERTDDSWFDQSHEVRHRWRRFALAALRGAGISTD